MSIDINDSTIEEDYKEVQVQDMSSIDFRESKQSRSYIQSKSLLDNFVEFVRQQEESRVLKRKEREERGLCDDKQPTSPFSNYENRLKSSYMKQSINLRQKIYTPIMNMSRSFYNTPNYANSCQNKNKRRFAFEQVENHQKEDLMQSLEQKFNNSVNIKQLIDDDYDYQNSCEQRLTQLFTILTKQSKRNLRFALDYLKSHRQLKKFQEIIMGQLVKQSLYKSFIKFKVNSIPARVKKMLIQNMNNTFQQYMKIKLIKSFNQWKELSIIEDYEERVELLNNDLIIERSKMITVVAFSKLNLKIELISKQKAFRQLILNNLRQANSNVEQENQMEMQSIKSQTQKEGNQANSITKTENTHKKINFKKQRFLNNKENSYNGMRQIQRLVHSTQTIDISQSYKLAYKPSSQVIVKPVKKPSCYENITIEIEFDENADQENIDQLPFYANQSNLISTLAAMNDESLLKFSPSKTARSNRYSLAYGQKLNLSNIAKTNAPDHTIDEEDHVILSRLIQKYQRDFNQLQANNNGIQQFYGSNGSQGSTLNLNSHETQGLSIIGNVSYHKKYNSTLNNGEKSTSYIQNKYILDQNTKQQELLANMLNNYQSTQQNQHKHIMIDEDDEEQEEEEDDDEDEEEENTLEDKLSFTSPSSLRLYNMNSKRKSSYIFHDKQDNSISVSKIEEIDCQNNSQTRIDIQEFQNPDGVQNDLNNGEQPSHNKKDFSFSIEKERDQQYYFSHNNKNRRKAKKKEASSRNYYNNNILKSKQIREKIALNELTDVLNQQYVLQNQIQRQSDLIPGGTVGTNGKITTTTYSVYNPQLEQETANFNIGDWQHRSPLGSTHQNLHRPLTRSSLMNKSSQRSVTNQSPNYGCVNSPGGDINHHLRSIEHNKSQRLFIQRNQLSLICSPDGNGGLQSMKKPSTDHEPIDTVSKLNFNYVDEQQECNSPIQIQSHFANFSQDFISPERMSKGVNLGMTTQRKEQLQNTNIMNQSALLNTSGATTLAQQSAFEQFRTRLNENLKNLKSQNNSNGNILDPNSNFKSNQNLMPKSVNISPNQHHQNQNISRVLESKVSQYENQYLSKQASTTKYNETRQIETNRVSPSQGNNNLLSELEEYQFFIKANPIRCEMRQRESVALDLAEPMEIGSNCNSVQNFNYIRHSTMNFNMNRQSQQQYLINELQQQQQQQQNSIRIDSYENDEDDHDMTLSKSPEQKNNQDLPLHQESVPIIQFDLNMNDQYQLENLRTSQNFLLQTNQSLDNHFQKRTMSHNDLVQLGTMTQQTLGGYLQQRSMSIQQFENVNLPIQQNKYMDAFKQYEAEKFKRRKSEQISFTVNNTIDKSAVKNIPQQQQKYQNLFNQFSTQNGGNNRCWNSMQQSPNARLNDYILEELPSQRQIDEERDENSNNAIEEYQNIIQEEIKEIEAEEEESFILGEKQAQIQFQFNPQPIINKNNDYFISFLDHDKIQQNNTIDGNNKNGNGFGNSKIIVVGNEKQNLTLDENQPMIQTQDENTNYNSNISNRDQSKKPKEIVIQLDISSYATQRSDTQKSFMSSTLNNDTKSQKSQERSGTRNIVANNKIKNSLSKQLSKKVISNKDKKENKGSISSSSQLFSSSDTQKLLVNALLNKTNKMVRNDSKKGSQLFNAGVTTKTNGTIGGSKSKTRKL